MGKDRAAFEAMFRAHHAAVYRYALRRVGDDTAQDVVAETFLIAWRRFHEIVGDPLPWLLGAARRVCANQRRSSERQAALGDRIAGQPALPAVGPPIADGRLSSALARLSERDREALLLVAWEELSTHDAASVLGCTAATFAVRLHRARRRLARALEDLEPRTTIGHEPEGMATSDAH